MGISRRKPLSLRDTLKKPSSPKLFQIGNIEEACSFFWRREITRTHENYYKSDDWQRISLKMHQLDSRSQNAMP
ncbi:hypothetical protein AB3S75_000949 [Citrus x aurantiifolia]